MEHTGDSLTISDVARSGLFELEKAVPGVLVRKLEANILAFSVGEGEVNITVDDVLTTFSKNIPYNSEDDKTVGSKSSEDSHYRGRSSDYTDRWSDDGGYHGDKYRDDGDHTFSKDHDAHNKGESDGHHHGGGFENHTNRNYDEDPYSSGWETEEYSLAV
jgi:hypothetical protein